MENELLIFTGKWRMNDFGMEEIDLLTIERGAHIRNLIFFPISKGIQTTVGNLTTCHFSFAYCHDLPFLVFSVAL